FTVDRKQDYHRIEMANQAMSAVMGGVQTLNVFPAIDLDSPSDFDRRIAINLQHILKYEAFFDRVQDPLAGSYSIEQMTWSIASQAFDGI
ncbi:MAG: methylmalonyl-CoA mutase family protein, partial [Saprospiraceae bacterium]